MVSEQVQKNVIEYAAKFAADGYITAGFLAAKDGEGVVMTKLGADLNKLSAEDLVFIDDKSIETLEGNERAAAVIIFCAVRGMKDVGAVAIADSEQILAFSKKKITLPPVLDDMSQICGVSVKSAKSNTAIEVLRALKGLRNCCFLPDAGAVVTGRTLDEVHTATLVLDKACNCYLLAESKGGVKALKGLDPILEHLVFKLKYSKTNQKNQAAAEKGEAAKTEERPSAIDSPDKLALATEVQAAGVRMLEENLVQGTWGNISVRYSDDMMLCTPSGIDYVMLKPEQMALVNTTSLEWTGSNKPTSEKGIHAGLMNAKKSTQWVLHSHPVYGCILAARGQDFDVPAEFQSVLGAKIPCSNGGLPGTGKLVKSALEAIGDAPAVILKNHGTVVRGDSLEQAFEICRALEAAAKQYLGK